MHRTKVRVVEDALDANNTIAQANRADFDRAGVTVVNLMSAPGAGKTTLLERARRRTCRGVRVGVLEGDVPGCSTPTAWPSCTSRSSQLNTDNGFGGECHLDANMVRSALPGCRCEEIDLLIVENVGNLVCPAEFRIGEDARIMVCSVTEGEDKPLKYPLMFRACELVVINKIDLLEHLDFDLDRSRQHRAGQPGVRAMRVSARTGEGIEALRDWLLQFAPRARRRARVTRGGAARRRPPRASTRCWRGARRPTRVLRRPRPSALARLCHRWPSASRAAAGCSRSARRRPIAPTRATSPSSSCTR